VLEIIVVLLLLLLLLLQTPLVLSCSTVKAAARTDQ
jgi:hypothetical protein